MIEIIKYILLGLIQGFAEPLPISSSGHLILAQHFFNIDLPGLTFEMFTNLGSLIAILIFFRKKLIEIIKHFFLYIKTREDKFKSDFFYALFIILATIPVIIFGFLLKDIFEEYLSSIYTVATMLLVTAVVLFIINTLKFEKEKDDTGITILDSILIGFAQVVSLIPGISRSGATVSAARARKISIDSALKFSFLLYIPVSLGAGILGISDLARDSELSSYIGYYIISFIASGIATFFAIGLFTDILKRAKLYFFSIYCICIAVLVFAFGSFF